MCENRTADNWDGPDFDEGADDAMVTAVTSVTRNLAAVTGAKRCAAAVMGAAGKKRLAAVTGAVAAVTGASSAVTGEMEDFQVGDEDIKVIKHTRCHLTQPKP